MRTDENWMRTDELGDFKGVEVEMKIEYMTIASQVTNSMQLELALTQEI